MIFSYTILKLSNNQSDCVTNISIMLIRSGMIADCPRYYKNHVLKVLEESQIALLGGEWRFLKIQNNFIPVTKIKGQWP